jgi:cytoskeletal protein CcmA (bactofilin family)
MFGPKTKKPGQPSIDASIPERVVAEPASQIETEKATSVPCAGPVNVIGKGTVIQGNIIAEGDLVIEGTVRGDVTTKTTLIIGTSCVVEGNIVAEHAEVAGKVKGTVQALGLLVIKSSSMIDGDVLTKNLNVESGSTFNGRFTVGSVSSSNGAKKNDIQAVVTDSVLGGEIRRPTPSIAATPSKV